MASAAARSVLRSSPLRNAAARTVEIMKVIESGRFNGHPCAFARRDARELSCLKLESDRWIGFGFFRHVLDQ
ncbi:hypothetical protein QJS10_CPB12g00983 [Acorus calamus]|uniref:Uncharacterized protein n=1 Tax=Acorus calamus TaxID=4465 RepID=A0AAV9DQZ4_ACOCL|nr:hypothetical protein QJS10_CPB12g00983 [Acorus calamus]